MATKMRRVGFALLTLATVLVAAASPTSAVEPGSVGPGESGYTVTIAARVCEEYTDVRANRLRNELVENLEPLGPDTNYVAGDVVTAADEDAPPQDACAPLEDWQFTLGTGVNFASASNPLSTVWGADANSIVTAASVPELDAAGVPTGATIAGATTIELTAPQVDRSQIASNFFWGLWLQGGTPSDPLLTAEFQDTYEFAALRCGDDFQHADNVEYIHYEAESTHVNCYAYYIAEPTPPPTTTTTTTTSTTSTTTTTALAVAGDNTAVSPANVANTPNVAVQGTSVLPATGSSTGTLLGWAGVSFILGVGALLLSRRRSD
jgi:LPXTG-motif cell wall-anchored protein